MGLVTRAADRLLALVVPRTTAGACCVSCGYLNCGCTSDGLLRQKYCCANCNCRGIHCGACYTTNAHCT